MTDQRGVTMPRPPQALATDTRAATKQLEQRTDPTADPDGFCITCTLPTYEAGIYESVPNHGWQHDGNLIGLLVWSAAGGDVIVEALVDGAVVAEVAQVGAGVNFVAVPSVPTNTFLPFSLTVDTITAEAFNVQAFFKNTTSQGGGHLNLIQQAEPEPTWEVESRAFSPWPGDVSDAYEVPIDCTLRRIAGEVDYTIRSFFHDGADESVDTGEFVYDVEVDRGSGFTTEGTFTSSCPADGDEDELNAGMFIDLAAGDLVRLAAVDTARRMAGWDVQALLEFSAPDLPVDAPPTLQWNRNDVDSPQGPDGFRVYRDFDSVDVGWSSGVITWDYDMHIDAVMMTAAPFAGTPGAEIQVTIGDSVVVLVNDGTTAGAYSHRYEGLFVPAGTDFEAVVLAAPAPMSVNLSLSIKEHATDWADHTDGDNLHDITLEYDWQAP